MAQAESAVMGVLGRRGLADGRYCEHPDGMAWLSMEAREVTAAIVDGRDPSDVLIDTGFWVPEDEGPFPDDLRAQLIEAATAGNTNQKGTFAMRVNVRIQARQWVELDLVDADVEKYGLASVVEEFAVEAFDPHAADWEYDVEETVDA